MLRVGWVESLEGGTSRRRYWEMAAESVAEEPVARSVGSVDGKGVADAVVGVVPVGSSTGQVGVGADAGKTVVVVRCLVVVVPFLEVRGTPALDEAVLILIHVGGDDGDAVPVSLPFSAAAAVLFHSLLEPSCRPCGSHLTHSPPQRSPSPRK